MKKNMSVLVFAAMLVLTAAFCSQAAEYPAKAVTAVVPFSPGGGNDIIIRLISKYINPYLKQSLVVENKPGAGGQIGWTDLAKARSDGYKIGATAQPSMVLIKSLRQNVPFNLDDFKYICNFQADPLIWVVGKNSKFKSAEDVVVFAKANPGKLNIAGDGPLSNVQLQHLIYSDILKIQTNFVPYSGSGPAITALMGNQVDVALTTLSSATSHIESGRVIPLVMFYDEKIDGVDIKSSQAVFKTKIPPAGTSIRGVAAPKGIKPEIAAELEEAFKKVTEDPEFLKQTKSLGIVIKFVGSKDAENMVRDTQKIVDEYKALF